MSRERDGNRRSGSAEEGPGYYRQNHQNDTVELASRMVLVQNKRFYLDVKENQRGRFIKIAEVSIGGNKNRLTLSMPIAQEFGVVLAEFIRHYATLGPTSPETVPEDKRLSLMSDRISRENKRYFLDLKENQRGRYLRVRQQLQIPYQNFQNGQQNTSPPQIAIPAQGMVMFRDALVQLIDEFGKDMLEQPDLPPSMSIGSRSAKQFFLDVGQNQRGVYMRITEQTKYYRNNITIPEKHWGRIGDFLKSSAEQMEEYYDQVGRPDKEDDVESLGEDVGKLSKLSLEDGAGDGAKGEE